MDKLIIFLVAVYCILCYGFMFRVLYKAIIDGIIGIEDSERILFTFLLSPIYAPYVYGILLSKD